MQLLVYVWSEHYVQLYLYDLINMCNYCIGIWEAAKCRAIFAHAKLRMGVWGADNVTFDLCVAGDRMYTVGYLQADQLTPVSLHMSLIFALLLFLPSQGSKGSAQVRKFAKYI